MKMRRVLLAGALLLMVSLALPQETTINGGRKVGGTIAYTNDISPAQITADQNNYNPTGLSNAAVLRLSTDASRTITGLAGGADGRQITIINIGSFDLVLANESASSSAANQFSFGASLTIPAKKGVILLYDSTSSFWRGAGNTVGAAGGSGDVTDVFSCASGDCNSITIASAEVLDGGAGGTTVDATNEGILLPRHTSCVAATTEGQVCWKTDTDAFFIGDGAAAKQIGGSSSKPFIIIRPNQNEPPASNFATMDLRNNHPVLDFDDTTDECAVFTQMLPTGYAGGGLTVTLTWACSTEVDANEDVYWESYIERIDAGTLDLDGDSFASAKTASGLCSTTTGITTETQISHASGAEMDSLAAGEPFRIKICRDANNASDDAEGDSELVTVSVEEP